MSTEKSNQRKRSLKKIVDGNGGPNEGKTRPFTKFEKGNSV